MDTKQCIECGIDKPLSDFYLQHHSRKAPNGVCWDCTKRLEKNRKQRERYKSDPEAPKKKRAYTAAARLACPKKQAASKVVKSALKAGILVRPERCECCGSTARLVAHHDDYDKPLEVRWLCGICHCKWHKNNTALNIEGEVPAGYYKLSKIKSDGADKVPIEAA